MLKLLASSFYSEPKIHTIIKPLDINFYDCIVKWEFKYVLISRAIGIECCIFFTDHFVCDFLWWHKTSKWFIQPLNELETKHIDSFYCKQ